MYITQSIFNSLNFKELEMGVGISRLCPTYMNYSKLDIVYLKSLTYRSTLIMP